jgi:hypothetical protein
MYMRGRQPLSNGAYISNCMLIHCYRLTEDHTVRDRVFQLVCRSGGWYSDRKYSAYAYIPADHASWLLLIDPTARHLKSEDWIV